MSAFTLPKPKTQAEFDALCESYRSSLATTFDFVIGDKKTNKLRDAVSRMLGYPNGYQQLKPQLRDSTPPPAALPVDAWLAYQSHAIQSACRDSLGERIVLRFYDEMFFDHEFFGLTHIDRPDFKVDKNGVLDGYDYDHEIDITSRLNEQEIGSMLDYLRLAYDCVGMIITIPDVGKYGVPDNANSKLALEHVENELDFNVPDHEAFYNKHIVEETHDDGSGQVFLMLQRRR